MKKTFLFAVLFAIASVAYTQKTPFTTADVLNIVSFSVQDVTDDGVLIAGTTYTRKDRLNVDHKAYGNPNYVSPSFSRLVILNTNTGVQTPVLAEPGILGNIKWSPDGKSLAFISYEDGLFRLNIFDITKNKSRRLALKTDREIASNSGVIWTPDGKGILLSFREKGWKEKGDSLFKEATIGPITVYDSKLPFLKWDQIRNHSSLAMSGLVDVNGQTVKMLLKEDRYGSLNLSADGKYLSFMITYPKKTVYDNQSGSDYELKYIEISNPDSAKVLIKKSDRRISANWNPDKNKYAYADSGKIFIRAIDSSNPVRIGRDTVEISGKDTAKVRLSINRWSPDGNKILASSSKGYWLLDVISGSMEDVYRFPEKPETEPTLAVTAWSPDGRYLYMTTSAKDKWERGLVRYDLADKSMEELIKDSNLYSGWQLNKTGDKFIYNISDGDLPGELYIADINLQGAKQLTNMNPWLKDRTISKSQLD